MVTICYHMDMTRDQQAELCKTLRAKGYRARLQRHGDFGWRATVSQTQRSSPLDPLEPDGELLSHRARRRRLRSCDCHSGPQVAAAPMYYFRWDLDLLAWFRVNGWPHVRILRASTSDVVYELTHDQNLWLILRGELDG
jgi:hypothetical protein